MITALWYTQKRAYNRPNHSKEAMMLQCGKQIGFYHVIPVSPLSGGISSPQGLV